MSSPRGRGVVPGDWTGQKGTAMDDDRGQPVAILAIAAACFLPMHPAAAQATDGGAWTMSKPLAVRQVTPDRVTAPLHERVTLEVEIEARFDNPFDQADVRVEAAVVSPSGSTWVAPGFLYRPFRRDEEEGAETLTPVGESRWQIRLSFWEAGAHTVTVRCTDRSGTTTADALALEATAPGGPGMVRLHPTDARYFAADDGRTFFLIGANVCWGSGKRGTLDYDTWLPQYASHGANFLRVWLSPSWTTFAMNTPASGFDRIDLQNAWRLDYVLQLAERLGLRVMLCVDSFNILRSTKRLYGRFEESPYHERNGGPLTHPRDYFTEPRCLHAYRSRLRYLVARYGYSPNVFAWELWNEVDIVDDYQSRLVTDWHRDMARHLRQIDPWGHLITTSTAKPAGDSRLDRLPEMEFVQTHRYGARDMARVLGRDRDGKRAAQDRPHVHGEFGISHSGTKTGELDPSGIHLHNGFYSSVGQQQAGTPMAWWWDSYVHPCELYPVLGAFSRWIEGFDFAGQQARPVQAAVAWAPGADAGASPPPLRVLGLVGDSRALAWVQHTGATWGRRDEAGTDSVVRDAILELAAMGAGQWTVEWWDTRRGTVTATVDRRVDESGTLRLELPPIERDVGLRLRRQS